MGMSAASIAINSDGESRLVKFKLLFGSPEKKIWTYFSLRHKLKLSEYITSTPSAFGTALAMNCQFFRAMFFRSAMFSF